MHRVCTRASTNDALSPVAYRFGLARPGRFQPQPKALTPDRRRQPTSATVKEHGHTGWSVRSSRRTRHFGASCRPGVEPELRTARPPELTPRAPEGKAATGRQAGESACTESAEAHSQRNLPNTSSSFTARRPGIWWSWKRRTVSQGLPRSAARTVGTFDRPRCFPPPGILAGAEPRDDRSRSACGPVGLYAATNHALCTALH